MKTEVDRRTVDLSAYPDLIVVYLGMKVRTRRGVRTVLGLGPQIDRAGARLAGQAPNWAGLSLLNAARKP